MNFQKEKKFLSITLEMISLTFVVVLMLKVQKTFKTMRIKFTQLMVLIGEEMRKTRCSNASMPMRIQIKNNLMNTYK